MKRIFLLLYLGFFLVGAVSAFSGFDAVFDTEITEEDSKKTNITFSGSVDINLDYFFSGTLETSQELDLSLLVASDKVETEASLRFETQTLQVQVDNLSLTYFSSWGTLSLGLLKKEWGAGDGVHVVDVLNAFDYSKGFSEDLLAMKRPEPMALATFYGKTSTYELFIKPTYLPGTIPYEGKWSLLPASFAATDIQEPKTDSLSYVQFGGRAKTIRGNLDLGLIYMNGYLMQSGYGNFVFDYSDPSNPFVSSADIVYTKTQLLGAESTFVLGQWTFMGEGGYFFSEDASGTDPSLYNSKWVYLGGIGYLHPASQLYLSLTYHGHFTLHYDSVDPLKLDVDYLQAYDNKAYGNNITLACELPLLSERLTLHLGGTYQIETTGYVLLGSAKYAISDALHFIVQGAVYGSIEDTSSIFKTWDVLDWVKIGVSHTF